MRRPFPGRRSGAGREASSGFAQKVSLAESLPCIEDDSETVFRSVDEVVDRAFALMAVAGKGEKAPVALVSRVGRTQRRDATARQSPRGIPLCAGGPRQGSQRLGFGNLRPTPQILPAWGGNNFGRVSR
jgi:hypothetical protein